MQKDQVATISFFRYESLSNKWWAFQQMGLLPSLDRIVSGLSFSKLLGSGANNGFSIKPNFSVYALLCVWENEQAARLFFAENEFYKNFKEKSAEQWTVLMRNTMAHGEWEGQNPFVQTEEFNEDNLVAVLTRATIKTRFLWRFWTFVPSVSRSVQDQAGRLFSIGIGELPLVQQATFSLWQNSHLMKAYAYKSNFHKEVVRKTRALGWYKEELFARFVPFDSVGSWNHKDILQKYLSK